MQIQRRISTVKALKQEAETNVLLKTPRDVKLCTLTKTANGSSVYWNSLVRFNVCRFCNYSMRAVVTVIIT